MPLRRITLHDFVIVEKLDLPWHDGFTVLTGETGAGKSILIDALQLTLGARADAALVRQGRPQADVCAEFDGVGHLAAWLQEAGLMDADDPDRVLLRRSVDAQGRSRAWVNGRPCTATQLRSLGAQLVHIHGQHAWQQLGEAQGARQILDAWAAGEHGTQELAQSVQAAWQRWGEARQALERARSQEDSARDERERLQWQIAEVAPLAPGGREEWEELNARHARLTHAQALLDAAQTSLGLLQEEDGGGGSSALGSLGRAGHALQAGQDWAPEFAEWAATLASCQDQVQDVCRSLQAWLHQGDLEPQQLAQLDERLSLWLQLARRWRCQPAELGARVQDWRARLEQLDSAIDVPALERFEADARQHYLDQAQALSSQRRQAAAALARAVTAHLQGLGMAGAAFDVDVGALAQPGPHGLDAITFLLAAHPGAVPRPLARVASGGELSRMALAIAVATSARGQAETLIFDEVDSGIGGAVAETVGRLMQRLGQSHQVLAITHLPQVAAWAGAHCRVRKRGALCAVQPLATPSARRTEIARMLGGEKISPTTLAHAEEMLAAARQAG